MKTAAAEFLRVIRSNFESLRQSGNKTFAQLEEKDFHFLPDAESNSIAIIIQHVSGNLKSRFSDFLTADGEKPQRNRDGEFEEGHLSKLQLLEQWESGFATLFNTLDVLQEDDLLKTVFIRGEAHSVIEALNRALSHIAYHVGQIVYLAKHLRGQEWKTLTIPKKRVAKP